MKKFFVFFLCTLLAAGILSAVCAVPAYANAGSSLYDPATEGILSGYFCIEDGFITGIAPGTSLQALNARCLPGDLTASQESVGTGTLLTSQAAGQSLTAIVTGDPDGDGEVTINDMLMVKAAILGTELTGPAATAGDANYDAEISITDFLVIKSHLLGLSSISVPQAASREPMLLLAPGQSQQWECTGASYVSADPQTADISADGIVTAGTREGTTLVYALDSSGGITGRTAVTVLEGGLQITLDQTTYGPCPGQSLQVTAGLNHPVQAAIRWETADSSICSVSQEGILTGHVLGTTTLRATLPNGNYAEAEIRVMPPITELDFDTHLHKLKPGASRQLPLTVAPLNTGEEIIWTSSDPSVASVTQSGLVTGVDYGTVTVTATGKYSDLTASCTVRICNVKQVAITFDDGPSKYTPQLLDFLQENEVKATFFIVGNRVSSFKSTVKRIVDEGHELGYHSYSHKIQTKLSSEKIASDFASSNKAVKNLTGQGYTVWRAPGGGISSRVLKAIKLPHIMWTVDTLDWKHRNVNYVYNAILNNTDDGEIILLHDLHKTSVEGAIKAMETMLEGDYEFLTVTELLSRNGTAPSPSKTYSKAPKIK